MKKKSKKQVHWLDILTGVILFFPFLFRFLRIANTILPFSEESSFIIALDITLLLVGFLLYFKKPFDKKTFLGLLICFVFYHVFFLIAMHEGGWDSLGDYIIFLFFAFSFRIQLFVAYAKRNQPSLFVGFLLLYLLLIVLIWLLHI